MIIPIRIQMIKDYENEDMLESENKLDEEAKEQFGDKSPQLDHNIEIDESPSPALLHHTSSKV